MSSQLSLVVPSKSPNKTKGIIWGLELAMDLCQNLPDHFAERQSLKHILQDALIAAQRLDLEIKLSELAQG